MTLGDMTQLTQKEVLALAQGGESILYKGPSGTGKTHNLLSWPKPMVLFYFDKNKKTLFKHMEKEPGIEVYFPDTWSQFSGQVVPAIVNREFDCVTIGLDTIDFACAKMWEELQGARKQLTIPDFGTGLSRLRNVFNDLTDATTPIPGKHCYNIVCTSHLTDVTDDKGALIRTTPKIMGAFKDEVEDYFDTVLLCQVEAVGTVVNGKVEKRAEYSCHTVPPNIYNTCKADGLPMQVSGTYPVLSGYWKEGVKVTPDQSEENK